MQDFSVHLWPVGILSSKQCWPCRACVHPHTRMYTQCKIVGAYTVGIPLKLSSGKASVNQRCYLCKTMTHQDIHKWKLQSLLSVRTALRLIPFEITQIKDEGDDTTTIIIPMAAPVKTIRDITLTWIYLNYDAPLFTFHPV